MRLTTVVGLGVAALLLLASAKSAVNSGSGTKTEPKPKGNPVQVLLWEAKEIPFIKEYIRDTNIPRGSIKKYREGKPGRIVRLYCRLIGPKGVVRNEVVYESITPPQSELYLVGVEGYKTSRGSFSGRKVLTMNATGYDPGPASCGKYATGYTATGIKAEYGVVAVDPKVIPLGTRLYVEGYGYAIAADVGAKVDGYDIDLCFPTYRQAKAFGRKKVKVHILD
ncbi:MAG: hypothetical protein AMXMBFR61_18090 [Fimbriimonadales bacterium]